MQGTVCSALLLAATSAAAIESVEGKAWNAKERFLVRGRIVGVLPDERSTTSIGGKIDAKPAVTPEIDITYFFTDHIAAEVIAATSKHDMYAKTPGGTLNLGDVWALPPTVTAQYHFNPMGDIRPYVGAGVGYMMWHNEGNFGPGVTSVEYDNDMIYALQAGVDVALKDHWSVNVDVKKMYNHVDARVNGAVTADIELDPWVVGVGLGYRF